MDKTQIERWICKLLSNETIENNDFDKWMWCPERYSEEDLTLMRLYYNNRKKFIEQEKIEAAKPEEDVSFTYHATAYRFYDCPTCDGEDDEAEIIFGNSLDELMEHCREYRLDLIYRNGKMVARCEYDMGFHRIHKVRVCELDSFREADEENVIKVY